MASPTTGYGQPKWWKEAVVYQIYPASFLSTGAGSEPGWGDINGITSKLDHIQRLGVDVVWVSPIYKSPQVDMGYDISDYMDIDPKYGSLSDVDALIQGLRQRGMKLMMDLVVNHTSDQHAWFLESRGSKQNSKRDWYIWQPPKYTSAGERRPPNNWAQILGEANSAWTWDETTQEYFLSLFTPEQPDLNWRNAEVRKAVHDVLRFWLDRGASGFRMDVINHISKVEGYPDARIADPSVPYQPGFEHYCNGPELHGYLQEIHREVLSKYDTITVGEMPFAKRDEEILKIVGADREELNMIFIFDVVDIDNTPNSFRMTLHEWQPAELRRIITHWQKVMQDGNGWNSLFLENHDNPRSISRYCDDSDDFRDHSAKLLCLMLTTLAGTLYIYQGQEIGQRNVPISWDMREYKDVETVNYWKKMRAARQEAQAKRVIHLKARDHARTPVQWTADEPNAGFCPPGVTPWMRVNDDYKTVNAAAQQTASSSRSSAGPDGHRDLPNVLQFWQRSLEFRKQHKDVLVYGQYELLDERHPSVFAYKRTVGREGFVVVLNFSGADAEWTLPGEMHVEEWIEGTYGAAGGKVEKSDGGNGVLSGSLKILLKPWEGMLGKIKG